jgi:hypothetical protein
VTKSDKIAFLPLKGSPLSMLQRKFEGIKLIIIDEYSMLCQVMFAKVDLRLRQATQVDDIFGGISVVLVGDPGQLQPVLGSPLYKDPSSKCNLAQAGYIAYKHFKHVVILEAGMRQTNEDNDPNQALFMDLIPRLRDGQTTQEDYELLLTRVPNELNRKAFENAIRIFNDNESVNNFNLEKLVEINNPILVLNAHNSNYNAKKGSTDDFGGLANSIHLSVGCNVTLTMNTWITQGLVNGSFGTVKDIVFPESYNQESMPEAIIVHFPKYVGPQFFNNTAKNNWIPVNPKTIYCDRLGASRCQFALRLAYAITTHKVQGDTLESGVIDLGSSERSLGTTFVQISRFKKLDQFLIQPFAFDRLKKIATSECLAPRQKEEKRKLTEHVNTLDEFRHLIP